MSWLDSFLDGISRIQIAGVALAKRTTLNFVSGATAVDNPATGATDITITGGGGSGNATSIQSVPVDATAPTLNGQVPAYDAAGVQYVVRQLTADDIAAGLTVTISGGSAAVFQCGATWTTTGITCSPACNAAGVTAATILDSDGGSTNVAGSGNPLATPSATYTKSGAGNTETIHVTMTKSGVTKSSNNITSTWQDRYFTGQDTAGDATAATASGANAVLTGGAGSATLTGVLAAGGMAVGTHFSVPSSGTAKYTYVWCAHTSGAATWHDNTNNAVFPMTRITSNASFANTNSVTHGFDLYRSDSLLTAAFDVSRTT